MLAVMIAMTGIAAANPWDLIINMGSPNQNSIEPNDILLTPGIPHISSLYGQKFIGKPPQTFPLNIIVECSSSNPVPLNTACHTSDVQVVINNVPGITNPFPSLGPVNNNGHPVLATDSLTITLVNNPQDPLGTMYVVTVIGGPGTTGGETASASRTVKGFTLIPEFPTVALPIAAVIGLVFFFQQKKIKGSK
jgi:hypothetical protein